MGRLAPVLALMAIAPWCAECSWGGFTALDFPFVVLVLAPLYGGAAVLIREVARRAGGGWPAIVLLAAAFGVYQAGLVDQSLFNAGFLDDTQFAGWQAGFADRALSYVGNHVALSICAPVALVESMVGPGRRHRPWLRRPGLVVVCALFAAGSWLIFADEGGRKGFMADPLQLAGAATAVAVLVGLALLPQWRRTPPRDRGRAPHPLAVGAVAVAVQSVGYLLTGWTGVVVRVAAIAVGVAVIVVWSRRSGWGQPHVLAGWAAGLVCAAVSAYFVPTYAPASPTAALVGDIAISAVTVALVAAGVAGVRARERAI